MSCEKIFFPLLLGIYICAIFLPQICIWFVNEKPIYNASQGYSLNCSISNINYATNEITYHYENCKNYFTDYFYDYDFKNNTKTIPCYGLIYIGEDPCDNIVQLYRLKRIDFISIQGLVIASSLLLFCIILFIIFICYNKYKSNR